jgi:cytokinin dehydrogenase
MKTQAQAQPTRRRALKTLAAHSVLGLSTSTGTWVAQAQSMGGPGAMSASQYHALPPLDGGLFVDDATITEYAQDFGQIVHERALAVLKPGSVKDISRMLVYARRHGLRVVGRGRGHTVYGQSQLRAGIVIDISALNTVHRIDSDRVEVDAGIRWNALLEATLARGLMPPALTDFIGQSVGGTLSVGGIGGMTHRQGAQVDNVIELQVVTGEGRVLSCSEDRHRELFDAVLAGQGQVGLIVRATLKLVAAPARIRVFNLVYFSLGGAIAEMQRLALEKRFDFMEAFGFRQGNGSWVYLVQAGHYYTPPTVPNDAALLAGLNDARNFMSVDDTDFSIFANRVQGFTPRPRPWIDLILPAPGIEAFMATVEQTLVPLTAGDSFTVLLIPMQTAAFKRKLFRAPTTPVAFGFGILRSLPPEKAAVQKAVAYNRQLFDLCRDLGGTHYPISAVELGRDDWVRHYGAAFAGLLAAKQRFDSGNVLTGGPDMF